MLTNWPVAQTTVTVAWVCWLSVVLVQVCRVNPVFMVTLKPPLLAPALACDRVNRPSAATQKASVFNIPNLQFSRSA